MQNKKLMTLVKRIKKKDKKAFEELYDELWEMIYYLSYRYLNNKENAQDITQEAFLIIYQKINELKNEAAFISWVNRIVINLCNRQLNLNSRIKYLDTNIINNEFIEEKIEFLPEELLSDKDKRDMILEEVSKLPMELKTVVLLFFFEEISINEIAKLLNIAVPTVYKRMLKAKKILNIRLRDKENKVRAEIFMGVPILISVLRQDMKIICNDKLKKLIFREVKKSIGRTVFSIGITSKLTIKIIISMVILSTSFLGTYIFVKSQDNNISYNSVNIQNEDTITLKTFVGEQAAESINSWNNKTVQNYNKELTTIIEENKLKVPYYYIDVQTRIMYMLYEKKIENKVLFLCEIYDSKSEEWNVVYQIVSENTSLIKTQDIKGWVEKLEKE